MSAEKQDIATRVAAHPFTAGMSPHHLQPLTECAMLTRFDIDQVIFKAGETANRFYLIENGSVALEGALIDEKRTPIDIVSAGGLLGWAWLFPPYIWQFDARATEPTSAIFFYGTILREHCEKDPALGYDLFKRMSQVMMTRLQAARRELIEARRNLRGSESDEAKPPIAPTTIEIDPAKNLIAIHYRGRVGPKEAERYLVEAQEALPKMQSGFRILADLTELEAMEVSAAPYIRKIMDLFNDKGIASVVRVIPNPDRDIGLQIMSLFHYGHDVRIITCETLEEARTVLARDD